MAAAMSSEKAYAIFVKGAITAISKEATGRSKEAADIREACLSYLNALEKQEQYGTLDIGKQLPVLHPLQLACSSSSPKVVELALGCLHKLVAHAWIQGESLPPASSGRQGGERFDAVTRIIEIVVLCSQQPHHTDAVHLGIIRALLTFCTAEHFVAHGQSLLSAVRAIFNIALNSDSQDIKRTACSSLLQALNTITKRVTSYQPMSCDSSRRGSAAGSPAILSFPGSMAPSRHLTGDAATMAAAASLAQAAALLNRRGSHSAYGGGAADYHNHHYSAAQGGAPSAPISRVVSNASASASAAGPSSDAADPSSPGRAEYLATLAQQNDIKGLEAAMAEDEEEEGASSDGEDARSHRHAFASSSGTMLDTIPEAGVVSAADVAAAAAAASEAGALAVAAAAAWQASSSSAESLEGVADAAVAAATAAASPSSPAKPSRSENELSSEAVLTNGSAAETTSKASAAAAAPAAAADQVDRPGSSATLVTGGGAGSASRRESSSQVPDNPFRLRIGKLQLTTAETDVLLVLTGLCRLASSETPARSVVSAASSAADNYVQQGKLLALELLVKVLRNPQHVWMHVRDEFVQGLRSPLCMALLRNCAASEPDSVTLAVKLLTAVLLLPNVRSQLKPELGAFYPLLLLRPLEQALEQATGRGSASGGSGGVAGATAAAGTPGGAAAGGGGGGGGAPAVVVPQQLQVVTTVLACLKQLVSDVQLVVDLFINYDCDLHAHNLFERTVQLVSKMASCRQEALVSQALAAAASAAAVPSPGPRPPPSASPLKDKSEAAARVAALQDVSLKCTLLVIHALEQWSAPLRDALTSSMRLSPPGPPSSASSGLGRPPSASDYASAAAASAVLGATQPPAPTERVGTMLSSISDEAAMDQFAASKGIKTQLSRGIAAFNARPVKGMDALVSSGVVDGSPVAVATFLRMHAKGGEVDKVALGEYLGHHEDFQVAVMHSFVDAERFVSLTIDVALRQLLAQFRLPGEAQKIDRIMEKFAERYVKDNPGVFKNVDGAYLLAFAIIMLNTDAHNPMAERRLGKASDFVAMAHQASDADPNSYEPVLPLADLEGIYHRVVAEEIVMRDPHDLPHQHNHQQQQGAAASGPRLALASMMPFKLPSRTARASKLQAIEANRHRIIATAEANIARAAGGRWHSSMYPEHARPMLEVVGMHVLDALKSCLTRAPSAAVADNVLQAVSSLAVLAGSLDQEDLLERCVGLLASAASVSAPASYDSPQEVKQLYALRALVAMAVGPHAGMLGGAWVIVLRTFSALNALVADLTQPPESLGCELAHSPAAAASPGGGGSSVGGGGSGNSFSAALSSINPLGRMFSAFSGAKEEVPSGPRMLRYNPSDRSVTSLSTTLVVTTSGASSTSTSGRMPSLSAGIASPPKRDATPPPTGPLSPAGPLSQMLPNKLTKLLAAPPPVRDAPGASLVLWVQAEGGAAIQQVFQRTALLDGEAAVVFMRALCAASAAELAGKPMCTFLLEQVLEVSQLNMQRIRLVWSKLWAIVSHHLVAACCCGVPPVAMMAMDGLHRIVSRLLERVELAVFRHQEDALRPYVAIMRSSSDRAVRQAVVAAMAEAAAAHRATLATGQYVVLEILRMAVADRSPAVVEAGLNGLQSIISMLFSAPASSTIDGPARLGYLADCIHAIAAGVFNSSSEQPAIACLRLLPKCAVWLAQLPPPPAAPEPPAAAAPPSVPGSRTSEGGTASSLAGEPPSTWAGILQILARIVAQETRVPVALAAVGVAFELLESHGPSWQPNAWDILMQQLLPQVFLAPLAAARDDPQSSRAGLLALDDWRGLLDTYFPVLCDQLGGAPTPRVRTALLNKLADIALQWFACDESRPIAVAGMQALQCLALAVSRGGRVQDEWPLLLGRLSADVRAQLCHVIHSLRSYLGGASGGGGGRHLPDSVRARCAALVLLQRCLATLHGHLAGSLGWAEQWALLSVIRDTAAAARRFNLAIAVSLPTDGASIPVTVSALTREGSGLSDAVLGVDHQQQRLRHLATPPAVPGPPAVKGAAAGGQALPPALAAPELAGAATSEDAEDVADDERPTAAVASLPASEHSSGGDATGMPAPQTVASDSSGIAGSRTSLSKVTSLPQDLTLSVDIGIVAPRWSVPGLMQLETQGCWLLMDALAAAIAAASWPKSPAASDPAMPAAAQQVLHGLCAALLQARLLVVGVGPRGSASTDVKSGDWLAGELPPVDIAAAASEATNHPLRAPLLAKALLVHASLPLVGGDVPRMFDDLIRLSLSSQPLVRRAVARFLEQQATPHLAKGLAAAAAATR